MAFACGPRQVAADGRKGGHSPFTKALLDNIAAPGVEIQQAMTQVRSTDLGKHRSRRPGLSQSGRTHREEMTAWREGAKKRCNQQAACQPSGNGISGQDRSLSLAAFGVLETAGMMKSSSPEAGAIAVRTTSSNTSNSTSLTGGLLTGERNVAKLFWCLIARIVQIGSIRTLQAGWLVKPYRLWRESQVVLYGRKCEKAHICAATFCVSPHHGQTLKKAPKPLKVTLP